MYISIQSMIVDTGIGELEPEVDKAGGHREAVGVGSHGRQEQQQGGEHGGGEEEVGQAAGADAGEEQHQDGGGLQPSATWCTQLHHHWSLTSSVGEHL